MQPFRFLLYCLSTMAGVAGLMVGGIPVIYYFFLRMFGGRDMLDLNMLDREDALFRNSVIFFLIHLNYLVLFYSFYHLQHTRLNFIKQNQQKSFFEKLENDQYSLH